MQERVGVVEQLCLLDVAHLSGIVGPGGVSNRVDGDDVEPVPVGPVVEVREHLHELGAVLARVEGVRRGLVPRAEWVDDEAAVLGGEFCEVQTPALEQCVDTRLSEADGRDERDLSSASKAWPRSAAKQAAVSV